MIKTTRIILLALLLLCLSVPGVCAAWQYSHIAPDPADGQLLSGVGIFDYPPEEIVPDDETSSSLGENHLTLIETIVFEESYGLNATKKPIIHNYLKEPGDVIYCSQNVQGGNLKHLMVDSSSGSERLYFVITKISDTEYHAFTMRYADVTGHAVGTEIEAYKTVLTKKDGTWSAYASYYGYAKVSAPGTVSRAIDVTTWRYVYRPS